MSDTSRFDEVKKHLQAKYAEPDARSRALKSPEMAALFDELKQLPPEDRREFGQELNSLRLEIEEWANETITENQQLADIDVTAPFDATGKKPEPYTTVDGSIHPITHEIDMIADIFYRMGFNIEESRLIDDDYHMFTSLNFPDDHPARDDYDTFMTEEGLIAPAHTSTMQNRVLKKYRENLEKDEPIAVLIPGRVFRNEDLDATHEHTFHQLEGVFVSRGVTVGNLVATLKAFLSEYFGEELKAKIQPFYFPFTEPSFEFGIERPAALKKGDAHADQWLELLGCGMIHPNVLRQADIDPDVYTGFAWGVGAERLVLMKYGIEDIRHFNSGKLSFLRQF